MTKGDDQVAFAQRLGRRPTLTPELLAAKAVCAPGQAVALAKPMCCERHLQPGERCDICGACEKPRA